MMKSSSRPMYLNVDTKYVVIMARTLNASSLVGLDGVAGVLMRPPGSIESSEHGMLKVPGCISAGAV